MAIRANLGCTNPLCVQLQASYRVGGCGSRYQGTTCVHPDLQTGSHDIWQSKTQVASIAWSTNVAPQNRCRAGRQNLCSAPALHINGVNFCNTKRCSLSQAKADSPEEVERRRAEAEAAAAAAAAEVVHHADNEWSIEVCFR